MSILQNREKLKSKLQAKESIYGAWTSSSDAMAAELFATILKPDFIVVDLEHSTISLEAAKNSFTAIQANKCCALPRLASLDPVAIKRLMDAGADGIIAPAVNNSADLEQLIRAIKYPPIGTRGYGVARAQGYGSGFQEYADTWNSSSILIIIIETLEGVKNIDALASHSLVDGILVGAYDLSGAFHVPGNLSDSRVKDTIDIIVNSCHKYKKSCGTALNQLDKSSLEDAKKKANFIVLANDITALSQWATKAQKLITHITK